MPPWRQRAYRSIGDEDHPFHQGMTSLGSTSSGNSLRTSVISFPFTASYVHDYIRVSPLASWCWTTVLPLPKVPERRLPTLRYREKGVYTLWPVTMGTSGGSFSLYLLLYAPGSSASWGPPPSPLLNPYPGNGLTMLPCLVDHSTVPSIPKGTIILCSTTGSPVPLPEYSPGYLIPGFTLGTKSIS